MLLPPVLHTGDSAPIRATSTTAIHPSDLETALAEYEEAMFVRRAKAAIEAAKTFELCFDDNAPHGLINVLTRGSATTSSALQ